MSKQRLALDGGAPCAPRPPCTRGVVRWDGSALPEGMLDSGSLNRVGGVKTKAVEDRYAAMLGINYARGHLPARGSDPAVGMIDPNPGDEIITTPLADMGTVIVILFQNALPVFADTVPGDIALIPTPCGATSPTARGHRRRASRGNGRGYGGFAADQRRASDPDYGGLRAACLTARRGSAGGDDGEDRLFSASQCKRLTAGNGALVVTNDQALARRASFADKGGHTGAAAASVPGDELRISELQSAVTLSHLAQLGPVARRHRADALTEALADIPGLYRPPPARFPAIPTGLPASSRRERIRNVPRPLPRRLEREGVPAWV